MPVNSFENYPMSWKPNIKNKKIPIYKAIAELLEEDIKKGMLKAGNMLPPQRELADFLDVNLSTITRAFKLCEMKGLISATIGRGTFISSDAHVSATLLDPEASADVIEMGAVYPVYEPNQAVAEFIKKMMKKINVSQVLRYSSPIGQLSHRVAAVKWLKRFQVFTEPENVMITAGTQNALAVILSSAFQAGDKIGVDALTYPGIKTLANMLGIRLLPIFVDDEGLLPENLEILCKNEGLKGLYLIPECHNPTTYCLSEERKHQIVIIAKKYNLIIIEDAINIFMGNLGAIPFATLVPQQTIHICGMSKSLCAGLRVAFLVVPTAYQKQIKNGIYNINMMTSPFNIEIITQMIETNFADKVLEERRRLVVAKNELVNSVLKGERIDGNQYSNFRWLHLPPPWRGKTFEICAREAGVQVYCAERFAVGNVSVPFAVRIAICAPRDNVELEKGLHILKSLLLKKERESVELL